ncbi:MAG TPA: cohesin domain-containing protein [Dehalococcoidia bacterium]|nr:cohesin domain-containing protein [Dehalococcoidia bacterium]
MSGPRFITPAAVVWALAGLFLAVTANAQSSATIGIVATDADISGNTATTLGPLNACTRAEVGSPVTVDVVVDAVPEDRGLIGFQFSILYDGNILTLTGVDSEFLLGAKGSFEPFEGIANPLPDSDGRYTYIVADLASNPPFENIESGAGVLARLTFTTKSAGVSDVALGFDPPDDYPSLIDNQNATIGVDSIGTARIAVGQDCDIPPAATPVVRELPPIEELATPTPTPTPEGQTPGPSGTDGATRSPTPTRSGAATATAGGPGVTNSDEDDGTSTSTVVAVIALATAGAALAGGGTWLLVRRRGTGPPAQ